MAGGPFIGATSSIELFKGVLVYLIMRELPTLPTPVVIKLVQNVVGGHGHESITAQTTLQIIDEAMGAAHAAADTRSTT